MTYFSHEPAHRALLAGPPQVKISTDIWEADSSILQRHLEKCEVF